MPGLNHPSLSGSSAAAAGFSSRAFYAFFLLAALALALAHSGSAASFRRSSGCANQPASRYSTQSLRLFTISKSYPTPFHSSCRHDERSCVSCLSPDKKRPKPSGYHGLVRQTSTNCLWSLQRMPEYHSNTAHLPDMSVDNITLRCEDAVLKMHGMLKEGDVSCQQTVHGVTGIG